jgi:DNA-binding PadR family transcriptional regulator
MLVNQKEAENKLVKGLLDFIALELLNTQPMHGYQLIAEIRKAFGVYFGPSTVYPLLGTLESEGYVKSTWNLNSVRPRKVYQLTEEGRNLLGVTEHSIFFICRKLASQNMHGLGLAADVNQ